VCFCAGGQGKLGRTVLNLRQPICPCLHLLFHMTIFSKMSYIYISMYICTYIYVNIHKYVYVYIHIYIYIYMYVCIHIHIYIYIYIYTYTHIYICLLCLKGFRLFVIGHALESLPLAACKYTHSCKHIRDTHTQTHTNIYISNICIRIYIPLVPLGF